jgi:putative serine protease PepD
MKKRLASSGRVGPLRKMRGAIVALLALGFTVALTGGAAAGQITLSYPYLTKKEARVSGYRELAERVSHAYVHVIIIYPGDPLTGENRGILQQASGIIVSRDGLVVTAAHIARTTKNEAKVVTRDGREWAARIVRVDPLHDLALLRIAPFPGMMVARFANPGVLKRGDFVLAVGSPSRGRGTVTLGFVRVPKIDESIPYNEWRIVDAIEIAMEVESGHSGGPVFNRAGELVGMVAGYELGDTTKTPYVSPRITYAVPASGIRAFLRRSTGR